MNRIPRYWWQSQSVSTLARSGTSSQTVLIQLWQHSDIKHVQISDGWHRSLAQNLSKTQFNISHVEKKRERRSVGQPGGVKTGCLALHRCLFNNSWRLLKWPQTHTYKHLIVSTMIVYNGSLELYINNKALVFFLKPFPVGWVLGFQRNRVRLLHLKVARLYAAPLLWITWRKNFIRWYTGSDRTQAEQCVTPLKPTTTKKTHRLHRGYSYLYKV